MVFFRKPFEMIRRVKERLVQTVRSAEGLHVDVIPYDQLTWAARDHVDTIKMFRPTKAAFASLGLICVPFAPHFFDPNNVSGISEFVGLYGGSYFHQDSYVRRMGELAKLVKNERGKKLVESEHLPGFRKMLNYLEPTHFSIDGKGNLVFMRASADSKFKAFMAKIPFKTRRQPLV